MPPTKRTERPSAMLRFLLTAWASLLLGACATGPDISNIANVAVARSFTLEQPFIWREKGGVLGGNADMMLAKGTYRAERENELGTLFRGPKPAFAIATNRGYLTA